MKAQADIVYLLVECFVVSIAVVMVAFAWVSLSTSPQYTNATAGNPTAQSITTHANTAIFSIGNAIAIVWIASAIASIIATFFVDTAPVFVVVGMIALPIEALLSFIFHDFFFLMAQNSFLAPIIAAMPMLVNFWVALPVIAIVVAAVNLMLTYGKPA